MTRTRPGAFELPVTERRKAFDRRLRRAAVSIKRDANGRQCGDCVAYVGGECDATASILGPENVCHLPTAVACKKWKKRKQGT